MSIRIMDQPSDGRAQNPPPEAELGHAAPPTQTVAPVGGVDTGTDVLRGPVVPNLGFGAVDPAGDSAAPLSAAGGSTKSRERRLCFGWVLRETDATVTASGPRHERKLLR